MKKLLRDRGLVERGGGSLRKRGVSKLFHHFSRRRVLLLFEYNFFCLVNIHACCNPVINKSVLSCGLLSTTK